MLNIKEIAPKLTQKLAIAINDDEAVEFAEALIESYKAELLKEVGEPVGLVTFVDGECYAELSDTAKLVEFDELFTSDQVTAAITKATKPLEERIQRRMDDIRLQAERQVALEEKLLEVSAQLAAAQEE